MSNMVKTELHMVIGNGEISREFEEEWGNGNV
jgi:hypothetical protein